MFPIHHKIPTLDECRAIADLKPEFKEIKKDGYVVFDYMLNDSHTFDDSQSLEMRGIAFNPDTGKLVGLALTKFFNYGEKPNQNIVLDGTEEILEKIDGSMLRALLKPNGWVFGTRAGETDVSRLTHAWLDKQPNKQDYCDFIETCLDAGAWPIFEFWSPENAVVLQYEQSFLRLIAIRHSNGSYFDYAKMEYLTGLFNIPMCQIHRPTDNDFQKFLKETEEAKGIEGFVVRTKGDWVKTKCKSYVFLHRIANKCNTKKSLLRIIHSHEESEVLLYFPHYSLEIEKIKNDIAEVCKNIDTKFSAISHLDRKSFAEQVKNEKHSWILFKMKSTMKSAFDVLFLSSLSSFVDFYAYSIETP